MTRARDTSQTQDNGGLAVAPYVAGKNFCINGGMDIWQRGTSFTITAGVPQYTAYRWTNNFNGAGTVTQDTSLVNPGNRYGLRVTATATSVGNTMYQVVETMNVLPMAGKTVTFSAYVAGTTGKAPTVGIDYSTTVDDAFLGTYTTLTASSYSYATTTGSFQRLTATFAIPSTAKTLRLALYANGMSNTDYITWSDAQLEQGSVATPFSRAGGSIGGELALCQRYFAKSYPQGIAPQTNSTTNGLIAFPSVLVVNGGIWTTVKLPSTMRTPPTVTIYSYAGSVAGSMSQESSGSDFGSNSGLATQIGDSSFVAYNGSGASITPTNGGMFHYVATAEL